MAVYRLGVRKKKHTYRLMADSAARFYQIRFTGSGTDPPDDADEARRRDAHRHSANKRMQEVAQACCNLLLHCVAMLCSADVFDLPYDHGIDTTTDEDSQYSSQYGTVWSLYVGTAQGSQG